MNILNSAYTKEIYIKFSPSDSYLVREVILHLGEPPRCLAAGSCEHLERENVEKLHDYQVFEWGSDLVLANF